jgi:eukaryotic-like serine/threonine-protein kinase
MHHRHPALTWLLRLLLPAAGVQGVVHRDVKPENFYRTDDGHWKLGDFGSAVEVEALGEGEALHPEGTLSYSAPEYVKLWRQSTSGSVRDCTGPQVGN